MSTTELEARAAELRAVVNAPTEKDQAVRELVEVERRLADQRKQQALDDAKARMLGIKRGHGSLRATYAEDAERVRTAMDALNAAVEKMNARYAQLVTLEDEARALHTAHGISRPEFTDPKSLDHVQPPASLFETTPITRLLDHTDITRIARAAAAGLAEHEAAGIAGVAPQAPSRPRPTPSKNEEREARRMQQQTDAARRALRTIPGGQGL